MQDVWIGDGDASAAYSGDAAASYWQRQVRRMRKTARKASRSVTTIARAAAPALELVSGAAQLVPGLGAVAAPIAAAAALGRGKSLRDATLAAARASLPPGAAAGFDAAAGLVLSGRPPNILAAARAALPPAARAAFDLGRAAAARSALNPGAPGGVARELVRAVAPSAARAVIGLAPGAEEVARRLLAEPALRGLGARELARELGARPLDVSSAIAAVADAVRRGPTAILAPAPALARRIGPATTLDAALAAVAGGAARRDAGALVDQGAIYVVESGDYPARIAGKLVGDQGRWKELIRANPQKPVNSATGNFRTLFAGERLNVPASWRPAAPAIPPVVVAPPAPPPAPPAIPPVVVAPPAPPPAPPAIPPVVVAPPQAPPRPDPLVAQAQVTLSVWSVATGSDTATARWGRVAGDISGLASPRWQWALDVFRRWENGRRSPSAAKLRLAIPLDQATSDALVAWSDAELRRRTAPPATPPAPPPPLPPIVPVDTPPGARPPAPPAAPPAPPPLPAAPPAPPVAPPAPPAPPPAPPAAAAKGDGAAALLGALALGWALL